MICLFSGGLDSTVLLAWSRDHRETTEAITFDYGQRNGEVGKAETIARFMGVNHTVITLAMPLSGDVMGGAGLVVPVRNMLFMTHAVAFTEGTQDVGIAATIDDVSDFPDCRPDYMDAFNRCMESQGLAARVITPFSHRNKWQVVKWGVVMDAPIHITHSCYRSVSHCGECHACFERRHAFRVARIRDTTQYTATPPLPPHRPRGHIAPGAFVPPDGVGENA